VGGGALLLGKFSKSKTPRFVLQLSNWTLFRFFNFSFSIFSPFFLYFPRLTEKKGTSSSEENSLSSKRAQLQRLGTQNSEGYYQSCHEKPV